MAEETDDFLTKKTVNGTLVMMHLDGTTCQWSQEFDAWFTKYDNSDGTGNPEYRHCRRHHDWKHSIRDLEALARLLFNAAHSRGRTYFDHEAYPREVEEWMGRAEGFMDQIQDVGRRSDGSPTLVLAPEWYEPVDPPTSDVNLVNEEDVSEQPKVDVH